MTKDSARYNHNRSRHSLWPASIALLTGVLLFWAAGCMTAGRNFPTAPVREIETGQTTKRQIRDMFGPPWRVGIENGQTTWTYGKYRYRLFGHSSTTDLVIKFDKTGHVASYTYNTTEH